MDRRRQRHRRAKKKHELDADLAFWFHVNPSQLTPLEKIGYRANLERVKAQQRIHLGLYDEANYEGVYKLYLLAYGDERLAQRAKARALDAYVDQRIKQAGQ